MDHSVWNGILTVVTAILGGLLTWLAHALNKLDDRDRALADREAAFETKVAAEYVTLADFERKGDILRNAVSDINARIAQLERNGRVHK